MSFLAKEPIERAARLLQDIGFKRWDEPEMLGWLNDGGLDIIQRRPAAGSRTETFALAAGTLQTLDAEAVQLLDVVRNLGSDGQTPGRVIRVIDRQALDDENPDWHTLTPAATVRHYTFDERLPRSFYVYPPAQAGIRIEVVVARTPTAVTAMTDTVDLDVVYRPALVNYLVYRAMSKDDDAANFNKAAAHYSAYVDLIGGQNSVTDAASPNQAST